MKSRLPRKRDWAEPGQTPDYPQLVRAQTTRANERLPDPQTCIGFSPIRRMERRRLRRTVRTSWSAASLRIRVGLNINALKFRPLPDAEKVRECWRAAATLRHSQWFSRNPSRV